MELCTTWILVAVGLLRLVASYNVLLMMPLGSRSHKIAFYPIAEELGRRGHQVTFYSSFAEKTESVGVHNVLMNETQSIQDFMAKFSFFGDASSGNMLSWSAIRKMHAMLCSLIDLTYKDPFVQDLILHPYSADGKARRYDLVVVNALFSEFVLPLAQHLNASIIYASPTKTPFMLSWNLNIPNPAYVPNPLITVDGHMSFWQRFQSAAINFVAVQLRNRLQLPSFDERVRRFLPNAPSIVDIERNVSFVLSNSHSSITSSVPSMPYNAEVGGLHCKPANKLPKDLEDFVHSSGEHGVIYFAFGSMQKGTGIPKDMKLKFLAVFKELPQKVLWKHESALPNLPGNVRLIDWAPQQDILGHPKVRLFVSHGGGLSLQEAAYHGKPTLTFPLGAEQMSNVGNSFSLGMSEYLDWRTFTIDDLRDKINSLLRDPKYTENAQRVSRLFRDRPQHPAEEAAYWIEYVIRHDGAHHLKSGAENLNYLQYFLLDVVAVIVVALSIVSFLSVFIVCKVIRRLVAIFKSDGNRPNKRQTNKNIKVKKN